MFLSFLQAKNPALIEYAGHLLKTGAIEPDSYVLDLDSIEENARRLRALAEDSRVSLYFMSKQVGRNPEVSRRVLRHGFAGMVAVDFREAISLHACGLPVSHVGHLVQIPESLIGKILEMRPEVVTVYSLEKAERISRWAVGHGVVQAILLRVLAEGDVVYPGQEGGFPLSGLVQVAEKIDAMKGVRLAGVTAFPCFLYDARKNKTFATSNVSTVIEAVRLLRDSCGIVCSQVNMPSCNSLATIPLIGKLGGTHAEPGHSLTGTNPDNPGEADPLKPALVYATEVSHHADGNSLCFGGGHYRRSNVTSALVSLPGGNVASAVLPLDCESIDYHFTLRGQFPVGSPVLMAFRTQIFVTRSRVVLVEGLSGGTVRMVGTWDAQGNKIASGGHI